MYHGRSTTEAQRFTEKHRVRERYRDQQEGRVDKTSEIKGAIGAAYG